MNIVVCVKQVPDTWAERKLRPGDATLDRESVDGLINELDEYAIEEALQLKEKHEGEVTVLTMGPAKATESIRKALSMGADKAVHLLDDALAGSDVLQTSYALAQVLGQIGFDLVVVGAESTDARMGSMAAMLAERLGVPQLSLASKVEIDGSSVTIHRQSEDGFWKVAGQLPAVISVVEKINEPRYPSFKGIMAAKKKPMQVMSCVDAGIDPSLVGLANASTEVVDFAERPPRQAGTIVKDEGDGGSKAAEFLVAQKFI
ncbi:MAG TPA: electron transfer flavoprotein subunit beta/FixA family protein [Streptosporangiaceae bacterium]